MSVWIVSTVTPFRDTLIALLKEREIGTGGGYAKLSDLNAVESSDVIFVHVNGDGKNTYNGIWAFLLAQPEARVIALVPADAPEKTRCALRRTCEAILEDTVPAEVLISLIRVAALGFRVSQTGGNTSQATIISQNSLMIKRIEPGNTLIEADAQKPGRRRIAGLSNREIEVLNLIGIGKSNKAIAQSLGVTEATIKVHLRSIYRKVDVRNRTQAALWLKENFSA